MSGISPELFEAQCDAIRNLWLPPELRGPGLDTYADITEHYLQSAWGAHHAGQMPRFHLAYGYDPAMMLDDLGRSVHPVYHGDESHEDLRAFMVFQACLTPAGLDMGPREIAGARFGAITHDYGENTHPDFVALFGRVIGDKERGTKTPDDRMIEDGILAKIHGVLFGALPEDVREYGLLLARRMSPVADTMAARLRGVSHEWGEYRSTIIAGRQALALVQAGETEGLRLARLSEIGKKCSQVVRQALEEEAATFPYLVRLLERTDTIYQQIQTEL